MVQASVLTARSGCTCRGVQAVTAADCGCGQEQGADAEHAQEHARQHEPPQHADERGPNEPHAAAPGSEADGGCRRPAGPPQTNGCLRHEMISSLRGFSQHLSRDRGSFSSLWATVLQMANALSISADVDCKHLSASLQCDARLPVCCWPSF